jgi:hypothetical protein
VTLTLTEFREHVDTELEDDPLQRLIDAAYETLDDYLGIEGTGYDGNVNSELITPSGRGDLLRLSRRALAITSITEGTTELDPDDYELRPSGYTLVRLSTGTNPSSRWRSRVDVAYTTVVDGAERDRVAIALVKLDINAEPGATAETIGAWSEQRGANSAWNIEQERAAILASYGSPGMYMV